MLANVRKKILRQTLDASCSLGFTIVGIPTASHKGASADHYGCNAEPTANVWLHVCFPRPHTRYEYSYLKIVILLPYRVPSATILPATRFASRNHRVEELPRTFLITLSELRTVSQIKFIQNCRLPRNEFRPGNYRMPTQLNNWIHCRRFTLPVHRHLNRNRKLHNSKFAANSRDGRLKSSANTSIRITLNASYRFQAHVRHTERE